MVLAGRDVMRQPLEVRRELLERKVLPTLAEPVRYASSLDADPLDDITTTRRTMGW